MNSRPHSFRSAREICATFELLGNLQQRLRENDIFFPGDQSFYLVQDALDLTRGNITHCGVDTATLQVESSIEEWENERLRLQELSDFLLSFIAPIRRLPTEILLRIVLHSGGGTVHLRAARAPMMSPDQVILPTSHSFARTSFFFRQLFMATPLLWSTYDIKRSKLGVQDNKEKNANILEDAISKSHSSPLAVSIDLRYDFSSDSSVLAPLIRSSSRWKSLDI